MEHLSELLLQTADLLNECGWYDRADWFDGVRESLNSKNSDSPEFKSEIEKLNKALAGMGSFSDIPLQPRTGKMSPQEASDWQWRLTEEIGQAIRRL
jgi:hypothetical protein